MRRSIRILITALSCCLPLGFALAIGMGEVNLRSHLNDPLKAEIPVLNLNRTDIGQLKATLASKKEYEKLDIERDPYLSGVELSLQKNKRGGIYIYAYSDEPVIDPVINLVVSLQSPEGGFIRNYTLFFDPPDYSDAPVLADISDMPEPKLARPFATEPKAELIAEISTEVKTTVPASLESPPSLAKAFIPKPSAKSAADKSVVPKPAVKQTQAPEMRRNEDVVVVTQKPVTLAASSYSRGAPMSTSNRVYGPTRRNQTLWNVAKQISPDTSGNMNQIVWALYSANPDAFAYDNINGLKAGSHLRIPSEQSILGVNPAKARAAMQQQRYDWQQMVQPVYKLTRKTVKAIPKKTASYPSASTDSQQELKPVSRSTREASPESTIEKIPAKLVSVDSRQAKTAEQSDGSNVATGPHSSEVRKLRASLAASADALTTEKQKNQVLVQRVEGLNKEIADLENEIEQTREQIEQLEKTKQAEGLSQLATMPEVAGKPTVDATADQTTPVPTESTTTVSEPESIKSLTEKPKQQITSAKTEVTKAVGDGSDLLATGSNYLFMGIGLIVMLVGGAIALFWRRQRKLRRGSESRQFFHDVVSDEDDEGDIDDLLEDDDFSGADDISSNSINAPSIDAEEEASVFIAYGRYEKAINVLRQAILDNPHDTNLKMMLLECYANTRNHDGFEHVREQLPANLAETDLDAWQTVDKLMNTTEWDDSTASSSDTDVLEDLAGDDATMDHGYEDGPALHLTSGVDTDDIEPSLDLGAEDVAEQEQDDEKQLGEPHVIDFDVDESAQKMMDEEARLHKEFDKDEEAIGLDFGADEDDELTGSDESGEEVPEKSVATKLDLARVYIEMEDVDEARELLEAVIKDGDADQKASAQEMLDKL